MKIIEVCCAIILKDAKMLAVQRGPESSHPLKWEFPGGKILPDETAEQCIIREIEEELSVKIEITSVLDAVEFDYGHKQIELIPFVCKIFSGEIKLNEHIALRWFKFGEWNQINWSGADSELIQKNKVRLESLTNI
ncbi:MAG: (deoxy)nucleoside triphosphate pyrophosphohydrolase [Prolixibacteraceae bacterium]|jgi:8-oxo-dGTP diphosphatase